MPAVDDADASVSDLKRRAASGALLVGARGVALRAINVVGLLVAAKLLGPTEFGVVAFGLAVTFIAHFLSDGGLAPSLVRRSERPTPAEYQAVVGVQAAVTACAIGCFTILALLSGSRTLTVTAVFLASLPMMAFRVPAFIALERELKFGPSVTAEIAEAVAYNVWAIGGLLLGFGVYSLATAAVVKTVVGTVVLNAMSPIGWVRPRLRLAPIRSLLGFGLKFQGISAVGLAREQLLNVGVAAVGGYALLGIWAAVGRIVSVPLLLFESLWRVSYPVMSRMRDAGEASASMLRKGVDIASILSVGMLAPMATVVSPGVRGLLGAQWADSAELVPWLCLGLALYGPLSVVASGYLLAEDAPAAVFTANLLLSLVMLGVALPLLLVVGHWALAVASVAAYATGAVAFDRAIARKIGRGALDRVVPSVACGLCACAAGFAAVAAVDGDILQVIAGSAAALAVYVALIAIASRDASRTVVRLALQVVRREHSAGAARRAV